MELSPARAVAPMSSASGGVPADDHWAFEPKWDGMRVIVAVTDGVVSAVSRTGKDAMISFPELLHAAEIHDNVTLDGELVAFDDNDGGDGDDNSGGIGWAHSFGRLQQRFGLTRPLDVSARAAQVPVVFVIFDLLTLDGHEVWRLPFSARRAALEQLMPDDSDSWMLSPSTIGDGAAQLATARADGLEGIMAKRLDRAYEPGRRSDAWRKIKIRHAQEFVVCGWLPGTGRRGDTVGSLVLGCHRDGELTWVGNVGTGFTDADLRQWRDDLRESEIDESAFTSKLPLVLRAARWVTPEHVVQVAYAEWTGDGHLRQPSCLGRRPDVLPADVRCTE